MKIQLLGNCTILMSSENTAILFDPYFSNLGNLMYRRIEKPSPVYKDIERLDGILISHEHFDHTDISFLSKYKDKCPIYAPTMSIKPKFFKSKSISKGDKFQIGDFTITAVQANHVCPTIGYIVEGNGETVYFAGDTYYGGFMEELAKKYRIDTAILPVTRYFPPMTMGIGGATKCIKTLKPKIFVPMHKDLLQIFQPTKYKISKDELNKAISSNNIDCKLVYLNNGDSFSTSEVLINEK